MYRRWFIFMLIGLALTSCGGSAASQTGAPAGGTTGGTTGGGGEQAAAGGAAPASEAAAPGSEAIQRAAVTAPDAEAAPGAENAAQAGRMVIRTATIALQVTRAEAAETEVRALVQRLGGFVLESQVSGDEENRSVTMTFKVPSERFDEALGQLEQLSGFQKVLNRSVSGQDVTDEFVDLESRLRNLRATEARLLEFLGQARNVEEALLVNEQLSELQGQIEQAVGRINYLRESTNFATITVDLQPDVIFAAAPPDEWSPRRTALTAGRSLLGFAQGLADLAIALAIWSPVWGLLVLGGLFFYRRFIRPPDPVQPSSAPPSSKP